MGPNWHEVPFPGDQQGEPVLVIVDVNNGKREREIRLKELDEVLNPTWSADGNRIAFSGLVGGLTDLFVYDLSAGALKRLTNDAFAELDPAWAPDSRRIAFATDRFTTNLENLQSGHLRIAVMDVESGEVRNVAGFEGAKNISPQWTRDGRSLFFLSDRQGITNVYRIPSDGGEPMQLTNLLTGVSGITALSPAMSAAGGRVIFSAYEEDGYNVALDAEAASAGTAPGVLPLDAGCCRRARKPRARSLRRCRIRRRRFRPSPSCRKRSPTSRSSGWILPGSRRSASAPIRSARMPPAACRSCSATSSATTCSRPRRR